MFTGIITDVGEVAARDGGRFKIRTRYAHDTIALGASIACDGCCLTVTAVEPQPGGAVFSVDVSNETLSRTTLHAWQKGRRINLERALRIGDELGGHMVLGHIDGVCQIADVRTDGESRRFKFSLPPDLARFIATKGSVALDGISLTVNEVTRETFGVNLVAHTLTATTWQSKRAGEAVNLEIDPLARYAARLMEFAR
jgi:riboflavin synthase